MVKKISLFLAVIFVTALPQLLIAKDFKATFPQSYDLSSGNYGFTPEGVAFKKNEIVIKLREQPVELSVQNKNGKITTGINSIDQLAEKHKVSKMDKTFKNSGKGKSKVFSKIKKKMVDVPDLSGIYKLKFDQDVDVERLVAEYRADPNVEYAHLNYIEVPYEIPNDSSFSMQWALNNTGQTGGTPDADIDAVEAWGISTGSSDVIIAVVDTGVDYNHTDLAGNIWNNADEIADNGIDDDDNGYIDDVRGWDFIYYTNSPIDEHGHGTHCAGIISAATNNGTGVAGTGWNFKIMPIKVIGEGDPAEAIAYAADNGAQVISNSWGYTGPNYFEDSIRDAIDYAYALGSVIVFAAGNDESSQLWYPAAYDVVIAVAATDHSDEKAWYSNFATWVDVSAPGGGLTSNESGDILSTVPGNTYDYKAGTSMACPYVSGVAGLVLSQHPDWTNDQVRNAIESTTDYIDDINPVYAGMLGSGRINAYSALMYAPDLTPPTGMPSTPLDEGDEVTSNSVSFTWTQGTAVDNESGITDYYLQIGTFPGGSDFFDSRVGNVLSKTVSGCADGATYYARVKAKNAVGLYSEWSGNSDGITVHVPDLGEVLDTVDFVWQTGGDAEWVGQNIVFYYDNDAAESGVIDNNERTYVQTTATGPSEIDFFWKVSSESCCDYLKFYIDGVYKTKISGSVNWTEANYQLSSGEHILKWEYSKDGSIDTGEDKGWLDKVVKLPPDVTPPSDVTDLSATESTLTSVTLTWTAPGDDGGVGTAALYDVRYSTSMIDESNWESATQRTGEPTPQAASGTEVFTVSGLSPGMDYYFAVKTADNIPNWSGLSNIAFASTTPGINIGDAVDNTDFAWETGGDASWYGQDVVYYYDGDAAISGEISHRQVSYMQTTATGPAEINFQWKVSSESCCDFLTFYIDEVPYSEISGSMGWQEKNYPLSDGEHVIKWEYSKDGSVNTGSDKGWVDKVEKLPPDVTPPSAVDDLEVNNASLTTLTVTWTAPGDNGGVGTASSYDIRYSKNVIDDSNWASATQCVGEPSPKPASGTETFTVIGLSPGTEYYIAIKTVDDVLNWSGLSNIASGSTTPGINIGDAADNDSLVWETGGDAAWYGQNSVYYYDFDSVQSGDIQDAQSTYIQTTATGPIAISYYWKVSSQSGYDYLKFYIDEVLTASISGTNSTWYEKKYQVGSGEHVFKWEYSKNSSYSAGFDAGWLDKVTLSPPDETPPSAITDLAVSETFMYSVVLTWTAPGDDAASGTALMYDVRYSSEMIDDSNWASATQVNISSSPVSSGGTEVIDVTGLSSGTAYYFAVKTADDVLNWSELSNIAFASTSPPISIGDAVDSAELVWETGGNASWFGQDSTYYYDNDSAQSGDISHRQNTYAQTTATGPVVVSFYWKVSSESGYDVLKFYVDGIYKTGISGSVNWQERNYQIDSGAHVLKWEYSKDSSASSGMDTGWLDKVTLLPPDETAPASITDLQATDSTLNSVTLSWTTPGDDGMTGAASAYDIRYSNAEINDGNWSVAMQASGEPTPLSASQTQAFTINGLSPGMDYYFAMKAADEVPNWSALSNNAFASTTQGLSLAVALDNEEQTWETGQNAWYGQESIYYYNGSAAQSADIGNSNSSYVQTSITGPVDISFYWKVSSEQGYDYLKFYVDGVLKELISGEVNWTQINQHITSGDHILKWNYSKDSSDSRGADSGWLDKFEVTQPVSSNPQITSVFPSNGATDVSTIQNIIVNFNKQMNPYALDYASTFNEGPWRVVWNSDFTEVVFSHAPFANSTSYSFEITYAEDDMGNILEEGLVSSSFTFTTTSVKSYPYSDDMENGINGWAFSGFWHQVEDGTDTYAKSASPVSSWWYGQDSTGDYDNGETNYGYLTSPQIDLTSVSSPILRFNSWSLTEYIMYYGANAAVPAENRKKERYVGDTVTKSDIDVRLVQVSIDGENFENIYQLPDNNMMTWESVELDLSAYSGEIIYVRFMFNTMDSYANDFRGWYIDDFEAGSPDDTPPTNIAVINDGTGMDVDETTSYTQLSANWTESTDAETGIACYWYAIGTSPGGVDVVDWTDNELLTSVTRTGLTLAKNQAYYFSVKAQNNAGMYSEPVSSDGIIPVDRPVPNTLTIYQGWNHVGVSLQDVSFDEDSVFTSVEHEIVGYDSEGYEFLTASGTAELNFAAGYWIYSDSDIGPLNSISGIAFAPGSKEISLYDGWNQFSNPYNQEVPWNTTHASYTCGNLPVLYHYDGSSYHVVTPNIGQNILPWTGYWIKASGACTLTITK